MLTEAQRRRIARKFLNEYFADGRSFELWRTYNSQVNGEARAFTPYPTMFVSGSKTPYIGVAETQDEAWEIMNKETPEERVKNGLPEFEEYGKYWVVFD